MFERFPHVRFIHSATCLTRGNRGWRIKLRCDLCRAFGSPEPEWPVATFAEELLSDDPNYLVAAFPNFAAKVQQISEPCKFFATFFQF